MIVQSVSVALVKEDGERIKWASGDFAPVINEIAVYYRNSQEAAAKDFPFLGTIDPWGTTYFNEYQIPLFIAELERFAKQRNKKVLTRVAKRIITFIRQEMDTHRLIKFIGD